MCVCLFVCLSVRSHVSKTHQNFTQFCVRVPVAVARSSSDVKAMCVLYFRFIDDVTFSHTRANERESETTSMFRRVRQVTAPVGSETELFGRVR